MVAWATKRKLFYLAIIGSVVFVVIIIPLFLIFYQKPTCFDGKQNGDELGPDCGGSCVILCSFETIDPTIVWARVFRVTDTMYSVVAYVQNSNIASEAVNVPYTFKLYDDQNVLITERKGSTLIPRNKNFAIFEGKISVGDRKPKTVKFEFTGAPQWLKSTKAEPEIDVQNTSLEKQDTEPRIDANLTNKSLNSLSNIEVTAIVYDADNNAVGASQTFVDKISKGATEPAVFTWPEPFSGKLQACKVPTDIMLVIDRSGSMADDSADPPEPLSTAKNAALTFINSFSSDDHIGVVSFATTPSNPIESGLTTDFGALRKSISGISIDKKPGDRNTDLGDGLLAASNELQSAASRADAKKVIVGLTDGVATDPEKAGDKNYPLTYASQIAEDLKAKGMQFYMIGLGNEVNTAYLQSISTDMGHYYGANSGKELQNIYQDIATKICEQRPAVVEVITRVLPSS